MEEDSEQFFDTQEWITVESWQVIKTGEVGRWNNLKQHRCLSSLAQSGDIWILDSGSVDHMMPSHIYFVTYYICHEKRRVLTIGGKIRQVTSL